MPFAISASVPMSSSATIASPIPPPIIPPLVLPIIFLPVLARLKLFPARFAANALLAIRVASIFTNLSSWVFLEASALLAKLLDTFWPAFAPSAKPETANGAICVIACVIFPMVLASASSSNGLTSSNHSSTPLAVSVSPTISNSSAPRDTKPLGIFHKPVATPANADSKKPTSSSSFCMVFFFWRSAKDSPCSKTTAIKSPI